MNMLLNTSLGEHRVDLFSPIDISIPLSPNGPIAFHAPPFKAEPLVAGDFVGAVDAGAPVNFKNVFLNPHGNGTHTECVGHILPNPPTINQCLKQFCFVAALVTIDPEVQANGDRVVMPGQWQGRPLLAQLEQAGFPAAVVLRTLPNDKEKMQRDWSGTNPCYLHHEGVAWLVEKGVQHLLLDLPSVDREEDGGKLLSHHAFWQVTDQSDSYIPRLHCTITEMIFVPDEVPDGLYLLQFQIASMELDASPSKPVLYKMH